MNLLARVSTAVGILLLASVLCLGSEDVVPCILDPEFEPEGTRLLIYGGPGYGDFPESATVYIAHGADLMPPCFVARTPEWICEYIHTSILFEFKINGVPQIPDYIHVSPTVHDEGPYAGLNLWSVRWVYEFPAMNFQSGLYSFEGVWTTPDTTNPDCWPESSIGREVGGSMTILVIVSSSGG